MEIKVSPSIRRNREQKAEGGTRRTEDGGAEDRGPKTDGRGQKAACHGVAEGEDGRTEDGG